MGRTRRNRRQGDWVARCRHGPGTRRAACPSDGDGGSRAETSAVQGRQRAPQRGSASARGGGRGAPRWRRASGSRPSSFRRSVRAPYSILSLRGGAASARLRRRSASSRRWRWRRRPHSTRKIYDRAKQQDSPSWCATPALPMPHASVRASVAWKEPRSPCVPHRHDVVSVHRMHRHVHCCSHVAVRGGSNGGGPWAMPASATTAAGARARYARVPLARHAQRAEVRHQQRRATLPHERRDGQRRVALRGRGSHTRVLSTRNAATSKTYATLGLALRRNRGMFSARSDSSSCRGRW